MSEGNPFKMDRYDLNARLRPALLVALPVLLLAAFWLPQVWTLLGGIASLAITCGIALLLSKITRFLGRQIETKLAGRIGRLTTVAALRHANQRIDPVTKARYHNALRASGHIVPTEIEEKENPDSADTHYSGCASWLLEMTRDKRRFALLADENIDYGFRRNLLGLKPVALTILAGVFIANALAAVLQWNGFDDTFWKAIAVSSVCLVSAAVWIWIVTIEFVEDASHAFAARLLAACDILHEPVPRSPISGAPETAAGH
ncbi:MAG: hypothetical protein KJ690_12040 [Alphaproteobacteria bacterium]|nr:hypothetical protein [Alphaproteobacteria bacterium]MBU4137131.1 hypothetical protein [Alphaproteobacteria bacterium]